MSLNWQWNDKMGTCTYDGGKKDNLYRGNAFMIAIHEWDNNYCLAWFAADKKHMQNQLGLTKEFKENSFADFGIVEFELDTKYPETAEFVKMLAKAKANVTIKLYHDKEPW